MPSTNFEETHSWRYPPLSSASSIRIIHLEPSGDVDSKLKCRLTETSLECNPDYQALSYVWGDAKNPSSILCNGTAFEITRNLTAALRRLRQSHRVISLWVDSICINQGDIAERSEQVRMMDNIYRKASKVLIWLGCEDEYEDTFLAMEYIHDLLRSAPEILLGVRDDPMDLRGVTLSADTQQRLETRDAAHSGSPKFNAFKHLFLRRPWFQRA
jgi:Heterokaryon incompatibility protein (HET)